MNTRMSLGYVRNTSLVSLGIIAEMGHHHEIGNSKTGGKNKQATNRGGVDRITPHVLLKPGVRISCTLGTFRLISLG